MPQLSPQQSPQLDNPSVVQIDSDSGSSFGSHQQTQEAKGFPSEEYLSVTPDIVEKILKAIKFDLVATVPPEKPKSPVTHFV